MHYRRSVEKETENVEGTLVDEDVHVGDDAGDAGNDYIDMCNVSHVYICYHLFLSGSISFDCAYQQPSGKSRR